MTHVPETSIRKMGSIYGAGLWSVWYKFPSGTIRCRLSWLLFIFKAHIHLLCIVSYDVVTTCPIPRCSIEPKRIFFRRSSSRRCYYFMVGYRRLQHQLFHYAGLMKSDDMQPATTCQCSRRSYSRCPLASVTSSAER